MSFPALAGNASGEGRRCVRRKVEMRPADAGRLKEQVISYALYVSSIQQIIIDSSLLAIKRYRASYREAHKEPFILPPERHKNQTDCIPVKGAFMDAYAVRRIDR